MVDVVQSLAANPNNAWYVHLYNSLDVFETITHLYN